MALLDLAVIGDWLWRGEPLVSEARNKNKGEFFYLHLKNNNQQNFREIGIQINLNKSTMSKRFFKKPFLKAIVNFRYTT